MDYKKTETTSYANDDLRTAVTEAVGAASMSWIDPETRERSTGGLEFDSENAVKVADSLLAILPEFVLAKLSEDVANNAISKGFRAEGDFMLDVSRSRVKEIDQWLSVNTSKDTRAEAIAQKELERKHWALIETNYWTKRLMLILSEVVEAFEELRSGRGFGETYYSGGFDMTSSEERKPLDRNGSPRKPEGNPSELADAVIRLFDTFMEGGIDLFAIYANKTGYNTTREFMHGRSF